jgi:cytochrome c oxidase subunit IV
MLRDGHIRPSTANEFDSQKKAFGIYKVIYPILWTLSRLDLLLGFQRGYAIMVWGDSPESRRLPKETSHGHRA